jgi:hypothetical protein
MQVEVTYSETGQKETFKVSGNKLIVGRSLNANVTIKREEMSRYHFQIDIEADQYFITDLKSSNGVFVNGERLPPEIKRPYNPLFPIEIADLISISLKEEPSFSFEMPVTPSNSTSKKSHERTLRLNRIRSQSERSNSKEVAHKKNFLSLQILLPVFIIAGIPLFLIYWEKPESIREEVVGSVEALERPAEKKIMETDPTSAPAPSFSSNEQSIPFLDLMGKVDCAKLDNLCAHLGLKNPQEGLSFYEKKLILFMNLEFIPEDQTHAIFKDFSSREKAEYFLAEIGTQNAIQEVLSSRNLEEVIVIGFNTTLGETLFKFRLNINYRSLPSLDQGIHQNIFQEIYFKGNSTLYQNYIAKFVDLIVLD